MACSSRPKVGRVVLISARIALAGIFFVAAARWHNRRMTRAVQTAGGVHEARFFAGNERAGYVFTLAQLVERGVDAPREQRE